MIHSSNEKLHLPPDAPEAPDREHFMDLWDRLAARRYLERLVERFRCVPFLALGAGRADETSNDIRWLFVEPCAASSRLSPEQLESIQTDVLAKTPNAPPLPSPLLPQLADHQRLVLLGDPGTGKSTLIAWLATQLSQITPAPLPPEFSRLVPVTLILRELSPQLPIAAEEITWEALLDAFQGSDDAATLRENPDVLQQWFATGQAWVMADGFDEISDPARRRAVRDALWKGMRLHPKCRWLVTSRVVGYEEAEIERFPLMIKEHSLPIDREFVTIRTRDLLTDEISVETLANEMMPSGKRPSWSSGATISQHVADRLYITPFHDGQIQTFLHNWFQPRLGQQQGVVAAGQLMEALRRARDTRIISRVPNVLTLIALLWRQFSWLPSGRTELYSRIAEAYSISIPRLRRLDVDYTHGEKHAWLQVIGWELQKRRTNNPPKRYESNVSSALGDLTKLETNALSELPLDEMTLSRSEIRGLLNAELTRSVEADASGQEQCIQETLDGFLRFVTRTSGLLYERSPDAFGFTHLSFQEYYAASHARSLFQRALTNSSRNTKLKAYQWTNFREDLAPLATSTAWRETGVFLAEMLSVDPTLEHPVLLLEKLAPEVFEDQPLQLALMPDFSADPIPFPAASLAACFSHNSRIALPITLRQQLWRRLWLWHFWWGNRSEEDKTPISLSTDLLDASPHQSGVLAALQHCAANFPGGLRKLVLRDCPHLCSAENMPPSLTSLILSYCSGIRTVDQLPASLQFLRLSYCALIFEINQLPASLTQLTLSGCPDISNIDSLPHGLEAFILYTCHGIRSVDSLPKALKILLIGDCPNITALDFLPDSLEQLYVIGCAAVTKLDRLPHNLTQLYLSYCPRINELDNLPLSLNLLRIDSCKGINPNAAERLRQRHPECTMEFDFESKTST